LAPYPYVILYTTTIGMLLLSTQKKKEVKRDKIDRHSETVLSEREGGFGDVTVVLFHFYSMLYNTPRYLEINVVGVAL
jgi:hypothetical protein